MTRYVVVIWDVGELVVTGSSIAEVAEAMLEAYPDDAILEVRREDYREKTS